MRVNSLCAILINAPGNSAGVFLSPVLVVWSGPADVSVRVLILNEGLILGSLIALGIAFTVQVAKVPAVDLSVGGTMPVVEAYVPETPEPVTELALAPTKDAGGVIDVETYVRTYFSDIPVLIEIARCESHFRHVDARTGTTLRGVVNTSDVGVMQINMHYHEATAQNLGLDLHNLTDNLAYARRLYEREGTQPWDASRACWQPGHLAMR